MLGSKSASDWVVSPSTIASCGDPQRSAQYQQQQQQRAVMSRTASRQSISVRKTFLFSYMTYIHLILTPLQSISRARIHSAKSYTNPHPENQQRLNFSLLCRMLYPHANGKTKFSPQRNPDSTIVISASKHTYEIPRDFHI